MIAFARLILVVMVLMTICYIIVNIYFFFVGARGLKMNGKGVLQRVTRESLCADRRVGIVAAGGLY
ncbi:hypothetical protein [Halomonas sp. OfavH-34-E]|uniref:hypothetical protein n=1 Tax=Halomonas sp. OfavH-34-E TaxID=2954491 RepID=UPI002097BC3A|nr:hypothetical protein [Halomonas sp. OfavH-34-E]MCO7214073.1 hypothetical protein [Halomonas sp. OfavH-34-E]